jgi:hypothetical protein
MNDLSDTKKIIAYLEDVIARHPHSTEGHLDYGKGYHNGCHMTASLMLENFEKGYYDPKGERP